MSVVVCGFNGFSQFEIFSSIVTEPFVPWTRLSNEEISDLIIQNFSWNGILLKKGGRFKFAGLYCGVKGKVIDIVIPKNKAIISGTCCDKWLLFITADGECWRHCVNYGHWIQSVFSSAVKIVKVSSSNNLTLYLTDNGLVKYERLVLSTNNKDKGEKYSLLIPDDETVVDVACGIEHAVLLTRDGCVYTFGVNSRGQLGVGDIEEHYKIAENRDCHCVGPLEFPVDEDSLESVSDFKVTSISAGGWHSAVIACGYLYLWGSNSSGQLTLPSTATDPINGVNIIASPTIAKFANDVNFSGSNLQVVSAACGSSHTVAALSDITVWGCGWNKWLQLSCDPSSDVGDMISGMNKIYSFCDSFESRMAHDNSSKQAVVIASNWNTAVML